MSIAPSRILVTRPQPGAAQTAEALAARGYEPVVVPLFEIAPTAELTTTLAEIPDLAPQALVFTSGNAPRALEMANGIPNVLLGHRVFAVGEATAAAARAIGFNTVSAPPQESGGDANALAGWISGQCDPAAGPILHLHGVHRAADLASLLTGSDLAVQSRAVYQSTPRADFASDLGQAMEGGPIDAVLHYSPRAARHFSQKAGEVLVACHVCLSQQVADELERAHDIRDITKPTILVAAAPNEAALLEALEQARIT